MVRMPEGRDATMARKVGEALVTAGSPPGVLTQVRDYTATPKVLEQMIDAGKVEALATFYSLKDGHFGIMNGGFTPDALFRLVLDIRRQMIATQGMIDPDQEMRAAEREAMVGDIVALKRELEDAKAALARSIPVPEPVDDAAIARRIGEDATGRVAGTQKDGGSWGDTGKPETAAGEAPGA